MSRYLDADVMDLDAQAKAEREARAESVRATAPLLLETLKHVAAWASSGRPMPAYLICAVEATIRRAEGKR